MFKKKYRILFVMFLIFFLTLSYVNAEEDNIEDDNLNSAEDVEVIKQDFKTLNDLNNLITGENSNEIILNNDYVYDESTDVNMTAGIVCRKSISVDGQGHIVDAKGKTRVFTMYKGNLTLKNIKIMNAFSKQNAGAIRAYSDNILLINCTFINCTSDSNGGVIHITSGNVGIDSSIFMSNHLNSTSGGVIYSMSGNVYITNSNFTNNIAYKGGVFYCGEGNLRISESFFKNNKALSGNGGVAFTFSNVNVINSIFRSNSAYGNGGIILISRHVYSKNSDKLVIDNSTFTNNAAGGYGGVIYTKIDVDISNSKFNNNFAKRSSGVLSGDVKISIFNSTFTNSTSYDGAGVLDCGVYDVSIKQSLFNKNHGEGIICAFGFVDVETSNFTDNLGDVLKGGEIIIFESKFNNNLGLVVECWGNAHFSKSIFSNNTGDIVKISNNLIISDTNFYDNNGNISVIQARNAEIINSTFIKNCANYTGVARIFNNANISNSLFESNTGKKSIGSVYCENMSILNSIFNNNKGYYFNTFFGEVNLFSSKIIENNVNVTYKYELGYEESLKKSAKKSIPTLNVPKKSFKTSLKTKKYTVTLKVGKIPIKNVKVYLTILGKKYKKTFTVKTDKKGKATFKITELNKKGSYTSTLKYKGNKKYRSITIKLKISVTKKKASFKQDGKSVIGKDVQNYWEYVDAKDALKYLNKFRTSNGVWYWNSDGKTKTYFNTNENNTLKPLKWSNELEKAAKIRAKEITYLFDHIRPDGTSCFTSLPENIHPTGENLAGGAENSKDVVELWQENENLFDGQGHRRNMLAESATIVGMAAYKINDLILWVQLFGYE